MKKTIENLGLCRELLMAALVAVILTGFVTRGGYALPQAVKEQKYLIAPTVLPGVRPEMKTPGFWISRLSKPDEIVLDEDEIHRLNLDTQTRLRLRKDILRFPQQFDGPELRAALQRELNGFRKRALFGADGREVEASFHAAIEENMGLRTIGEAVDVRFGLIVCNADQRLLPISQGLYGEAGDIDFDEVQNSALDIGMPVAILCESADRQWFYVMGPSSDGWIRPAHVALCSKKQLSDIVDRPFVTVVRAKGNVYLDRARTQYYGFARMGSKLPLARDSSEDVTAVMLPTRRDDGALEVKTGYLPSREVVAGHLPYTPRRIIEQAFEMLNTPYGWGGMHGEQDCSQFVQEVFATVGVALPRNSNDQAKVGQMSPPLKEGQPDAERRAALVAHAIPGATLLYTRGHVMLYIGDVEGRPYVIHDTWAYREPSKDGNVVRVINRVAVTDLNLGTGSRSGSLLKRLHSARAITLEPER